MPIALVMQIALAAIALAQKLQADGRQQTTDEETAAFQATLGKLATADGAFDAAFANVDPKA
jgi:hypothetical protein